MLTDLHSTSCLAFIVSVSKISYYQYERAVQYRCRKTHLWSSLVVRPIFIWRLYRSFLCSLYWSLSQKKKPDFRESSAPWSFVPLADLKIEDVTCVLLISTSTLLTIQFSQAASNDIRWGMDSLEIGKCPFVTNTHLNKLIYK